MDIIECSYFVYDKVLANVTLLGGGLRAGAARPQTPTIGEVRRGLRPLRTSPTVKLIAAKRTLVWRLK